MALYGTERQEQILALLRSHGTVSVSRLSRELFASEATIRRDLNDLQGQGLLRRVHGGAVLLGGGEQEIPLYLREREMHLEKALLAQQAVGYIHNGATILLDASSTVLHMVPLLARFSDLTVITNSPKTSLALAEYHIKNYCTGGLLLDNSLAYVGPRAERAIREVRADIVFFSCRGLGLQGRLSDSSLDEISLRQVMLDHAAQAVCLCDSGKLGKEYLHTLCYARDLTALLCDKPLPFGTENK